jgi:hypothetical protein
MGGSGGDGFFASHETREPETKRKQILFGTREENNTRGIEPVRSKTQRVRGGPFFSIFSPQKKPHPAWLTPPGSEADRERATVPSSVLLPCLAWVLRQPEFVTEV